MVKIIVDELVIDKLIVVLLVGFMVLLVDNYCGSLLVRRVFYL